MRNVHFLLGAGCSSYSIPDMTNLKQKIEASLTGTEKKKFHELLESNAKQLESVLGVLYSQRAFLDGQVNNEFVCAFKKEYPNGRDENHGYGDEDFDDKYKKYCDYTESLNKRDECEKFIGNIQGVMYNELKLDPNSPRARDNLKIYEQFYRKIALRKSEQSRVNVFTTNNDMFNEAALDNINVHYINGFSGGLHRYFNPAFFDYTFSKRMDSSMSKYEPIPNMVYLFKIHGSVSWFEEEESNNSYFKIREDYDCEHKQRREAMIYPTPTKQNQSLGSPYVDLFREFQKRMLEPNSVLFVMGYGFNDEHINNVIYRALATNTSLNVVIFGNPESKFDFDDSRVYKIWGEEGTGSGEEPINYFKSIVELLPDIDPQLDKQRELLDKFISQLNQLKK